MQEVWKMSRSFFVWVVVLACCMAGRVAQAQTMATCTLTASGAETFSGSCVIEASYTAAKNETEIALTVSGVPGNSVVCGMVVHEQLTAGVAYSNSRPGVTGMCEVAHIPGTATWAAVKGSSSTPDQGTFQAALSSLGPVIAVPGGSLYLAPTGSINATMPMMSGSGAIGTITFNVVFQKPAKFAAPPTGVKSPVQHAPIPNQPINKP